MLSQIVYNSSISSSLLNLLSTNYSLYFMIAHTNSIGFKSGLYAGWLNKLILFFCNQSLVRLAEWEGAPSYYKNHFYSFLKPYLKYFFANGTIICYNTSIYDS